AVLLPLRPRRALHADARGRWPAGGRHRRQRRRDPHHAGGRPSLLLPDAVRAPDGVDARASPSARERLPRGGAARTVRPIADPLLDPAFEREADRLTHTSVRDGNGVTLMPTGLQSYAKRWELIEGATKTLHLVSFSVMRDDTTRRLASTLADKVREGVE